MSVTEELFSQIKSGRSGDNWGLSMGMPKLEYYLDGVTKSTFTLLFANSGVGNKSSIFYTRCQKILDRKYEKYKEYCRLYE